VSNAHTHLADTYLADAVAAILDGEHELEGAEPDDPWRRRDLGAGRPWGLAPEPASSGGREARRGPSFSWGREAASGGGKVMREGDGLPLRRCGGRHQA